MNPSTPPQSASAASVEPFLAMEIMERAQELEKSGIDVVHLEVGEPDFSVPDAVARAIAEATRAGETHYTHSLGLSDLRAEIARYYRDEYRVRIEPERVIVTTGTSGGLVLLMALLLDPGDEVLLPNPGYACYPNFVRAFHGTPRFFELDAAAGFHYDTQRIGKEVTPRTRALIVNSPANPTAAVESRETLERLPGLGVRLISDEIYHGLHYETRPTSILEVTEDAFVLDGFSKRFAMTGLRVGWLVAPEKHVPTLQRLQQNLFICAGSVAQHAGLSALRDARDSVKEMRQDYARRRALLLGGLEQLGFPVPAKPMGAYYVLADARHLATSSLELAKRILEEAHVGVTPGVDFGSRAEGHLRFSFASAPERIEEGLERLRAWLARNRQEKGP